MKGLKEVIFLTAALQATPALAVNPAPVDDLRGTNKELAAEVLDAAVCGGPDAADPQFPETAEGREKIIAFTKEHLELDESVKVTVEYNNIRRRVTMEFPNGRVIGMDFEFVYLQLLNARYELRMRLSLMEEYPEILAIVDNFSYSREWDEIGPMVITAGGQFSIREMTAVHPTPEGGLVRTRLSGRYEPVKAYRNGDPELSDWKKAEQSVSTDGKTIQEVITFLKTGSFTPAEAPDSSMSR